jgi:hypothetical protein
MWERQKGALVSKKQGPMTRNYSYSKILIIIIIIFLSRERRRRQEKTKEWSNLIFFPPSKAALLEPFFKATHSLLLRMVIRLSPHSVYT